MNRFRQYTPLLATGLLLSALAAEAQTTYTWDPAVSGGTALGGTGTWDTSTGNWWDGTSNVAWDNTGAKTALFSTAAAEEQVSIGAGLTVGDVTKSTGQILEFAGSGGDQVLTIKSGGATWTSTGGNAFEFLPSAGLSMTSGDTLTVNSDGGFQAIGASNVAWTVNGATLDYTGLAGNIRGSNTTIGQFGTVIMSSDATGRFFADVNNTSLNNDWVLNGTGEIAFDAQGSYNFTLNGDITGTATMRTEFMGNRIVYLNGDNSAWTGGLKVGNASKVAVNNATELGSGDLSLAGTTSTSAVFLLGGVDLGSTRDLVLSVGGGSIVNQGVNSFGGKITGAGGLQIGHANHDSNTNKFIVSGTNSDHTGNTRIWRGSLELGADDSLSHDTVLQIGGEGTSQFTMAGFDAEIAGLQTLANNTRQINNVGAGAVLTITTAGVDHDYVGNINGADGISIVKDGLGTQVFNRNGGYTTTAADLTVNGGTLVWDASGNTGITTVGVDGTLALGDGQDSGGVGSGSGAGNVGDGNVANSGLVRIDRSDATTYSGVISGTGGLELTGGGTHTLSASQTFTGNTLIDNATLKAGVVNALTADSALSIGGAGSGTSVLEMNGLDQRIGGLAIVAGSHTRVVDNNGLGANATLTIDVATGESYAYNANFRGTDTISIVKSGVGTQTFNRSGGYNTALGGLTVTAGELIWSTTSATAISGAVDVTGGNLEVTQSVNITDFTVGTGATSSFVFNVTDWAGVAQTDFNQIAASGTFEVTDAASYTVVVDDANLAGFDDSTQSFIIATAPTMNATTAEFVLDATAFTLGSGGTWSLDVVGTDVLLTFTSTIISDPYDTWASGGAFDADTNGDGVDNGLAFILGAADENADALSLLPDGAATGGDLVMTFSIVNPIAPAVLSVEYTNDLTGLWTSVVVPTVTGGDGTVDFVVSGTDPLSVTVTIDSSAASAGGELFGRLSAVE